MLETIELGVNLYLHAHLQSVRVALVYSPLYQVTRMRMRVPSSRLSFVVLHDVPWTPENNSSSVHCSLTSRIHIDPLSIFHLKIY